MFVGAVLVGLHMALTHGVTIAMVASYIPTTEVPGIGRISGTCWSFTDFVFGAAHMQPCRPCQPGMPTTAYMSANRHEAKSGRELVFSALGIFREHACMLCMSTCTCMCML